MARRAIKVVGMQYLTRWGAVGGALMLLPSVVMAILAFFQQAAWDSYFRSLRYNETLRSMGLNDSPTSPEMPTGLPVAWYFVLGTVATLGLILLVVGRDIEYSGHIDEN